MSGSIEKENTEFFFFYHASVLKLMKLACALRLAARIKY